MNELKTKQDIFAAKVEQLHDQYIETLCMRQANLRELRGKVGSDCLTPELAEELRPDIHKTAGTAASFGYRGLSRLAASACALIGDYRRYLTSSDEVISSIDLFIVELDRVLENSEQQGSRSTAGL